MPGPDAPWVKLTEIYVHAASLPETERKAALERERDALLAKKDDPVALLMAADINRQLAGPNEPWNVLMERQMHEMGFGGDKAEDDAAADDAPNSVDAALEAMKADPAAK